MSGSQHNLLFVFSDQQHARAMGCVDPTFRTPNLDRLADEGTRFDACWCTTPLCSPARASLLTGLMPPRTGVRDNGQFLRQEHIGHRLRAAGYATAYFGKWHLGDDPVCASGWDEHDGVYVEYGGRERPLSDHEVTAHGVAFLRRHRNDTRPWALFLSYDDPHAIYAAARKSPYPPEFSPKDLVPDPALTLPTSWHRWTAQDEGEAQRHERTHRFYDGFEDDPAPWLAYRTLYRERTRLYDAQLGLVLKTLRAEKLEERTALVVTSDHGDMDTHHRAVFKGPWPYEQMFGVPLILRVPGVPGGAVCHELASGCDLAPTLCELAGADVRGMDGVSLLPLLTGGAPVRREAISLYPDPALRAIRTGDLKYVEIPGERSWCFDLAADPGEEHDLTQDPRRADLAVRLHAWCAANDKETL